MRRWLTQRQVREGERFPRGYRLAYWDAAARRGACYPVGLHWLAMLLRRAWESTYWYSPSRLERLIERRQGRGQAPGLNEDAQ